MTMLEADSTNPSTIIFSLAMLIPILGIWQELYKILQNLRVPAAESPVVCSPDLPIIKFQDLQARRHRLVEGSCYVCSSDYEGEDVVTQLGRCKHVFHTSCLAEAQRQCFGGGQRSMSCPFCRSLLFIEPLS